MADPDTRAVERLVPAGTTDPCAGCGKVVKFAARRRMKQIVANIYEGRGKRRHWDRVEHWHDDCYAEAGQPYGEPDRSQANRLLNR